MGIAAPDGYSDVTPWIICRNTAGLIDFMKRAFDAEELARIATPDGDITHAETRIGDAVIMAFDGPRDGRPTPAFLRLFVDDADAAFDQAVDAGATPVTRVTELAFGDRVGRVRDPFGNIWWLQSHVHDVPPQDLPARAREARFVAAMAYVQTSLKVALKSV